jgi:hypothetical protein
VACTFVPGTVESSQKQSIFTLKGQQGTKLGSSVTIQKPDESHLSVRAGLLNVDESEGRLFEHHENDGVMMPIIFCTLRIISNLCL